MKYGGRGRLPLLAKDITSEQELKCNVIYVRVWKATGK
jgi:hypothetical protein